MELVMNSQIPEDARKRDFANVPVVWEPDENSGKKTREFSKMIEKKYNVKLNDYWDLYRWSIENLVEFSDELFHFVGVKYSKLYEQVIDLSIPMIESPEWFVGARLNYAENLLKFRDDHVALIVAGEDKVTEKVTYAQMYEEAKLYTAALKKLGVEKGDRVSCFMSNRKEAIFAMLGTTSLGAIWLGALPLMGTQAVVNRLKQVDPKLLFTVDRFQQNKEEQDMLSKVKEIVKALPSLRKVIIVPSKPESKLKDISSIQNSCFLDEFLEIGKDDNGLVPEIEFEQVSFSHPVFISYTSGTTGLPKAVIHGSGGLLSITRDFWLHSDAERDRAWLSMSPVGWASWNIFSSMHFFGATVVLFEGVPYFLSPTFLWDMVDEFNIATLFLTPSVLDELDKKGFVPTKSHHLNSLKVMMSGGSVVKPQNYDFVYKKIKADLIFSTIYGATELMGGCMILDQTVKVHKGEVAVPSLGVDFSVVDDAGKRILGDIGEIVINKSMPSLPLGLWGDTDGSIFRETYFEKFPGKFTVGDLAIINPVTRGIIICGRSDDTLKPRGCRFGSSEIYNVVDIFHEVQNSLCVSQYNRQGEERAVLFLKMRDGHPFNDNLVKRIREAIASELSIRHVPEVILETSAIPHNLNGKKMEIIVKKIINKKPYNPETVINPECLENFRDVPELQGF